VKPRAQYQVHTHFSSHDFFQIHVCSFSTKNEDNGCLPGNVNQTFPILHVTAYLPISLFLPKSTYDRHMMSLLGTNSASAYPPSWLLQPSVQIYLITPWLPEKVTGSQLVKICSAFYGTRRFITALTRSRHLSLS